VATDSPITFIKQSIRDFRTTGAIAPSSLFLARAIAKSLPENISDDFKVVEVGAGTGSITGELVKRMKNRGQLDLWEISPEFCKVLRARIGREPHLAAMKDRINICEGDIRSHKPGQVYDAVVSGLPFNCFQPEEVRGFIEHFRSLLKPQGTLTWFEYVAIRKIQSPFVSKARRAQLKGINDVTSGFIRDHQFKQQIIPINFPPARVRQLKFG
jgi:phospholipid N-methyltransferase